MRRGVAAALLFVASSASAAPIGACTVVKITDGDTIDVACTGRKGIIPLRLAGIDAPEYAHFGWKYQPWAKEATLALAALCPVASAVKVTLTKFDQRTARWIGKAACGGQDASEYQAAHGNAWAYLPAARSKVPALVKAAQDARLGLWAATSIPIAPSVWRKGGSGKATTP